MSRKGNKLLLIPSGVNVEINPTNVVVASATGKIVVDYPTTIKVSRVEDKIKVERLSDDKQARIFHGTINSNINNALIGVSKGFEKKLKLVGVGYKASVANKQLTLAIGFSHPVVFAIPDSLKVVCPTPTEINISGYDKIIVGEFAANVRLTRKPEPYNGKGIMYHDEIIVRKVGKTAEGATGAAAPAGGGKK